MVAMLVMMPMITMTTSSSSSVKPPAARLRNAVVALFDVPVADVGIGSFTARLPVGTERIEVVVTVGARRDVGIIVAPRILAERVDITALLPVAHVRVGRLRHERL